MALAGDVTTMGIENNITTTTPESSDFGRDDRVFREARELAIAKDGPRKGVLRPSVYLDVLLFPKVTKRSPDFWKAYAEHWRQYHGLDAHAGLSDITAAVVLHVIGSAMEPGADGATCFLSESTIAARAHASRRSVMRVVAWQRDSPVPLVQLSKPGNTRGINHKCFRFTLIEHPLAFAARRDSVRDEKVVAAVADLKPFEIEQHDEKIRLQVRLLRDEISKSEYEKSLEEIVGERQERLGRAGFPRKVVRQIGTQRLGATFRPAVGQ